jgi:hypothetical protein
MAAAVRVGRGQQALQSLDRKSNQKVSKQTTGSKGHDEVSATRLDFAL